ncbi:hypothetical protein PSE_4969 [Pseudovibrio sp. FO-BEG1]|nr:hypothetical protein PSE_3742 [Pseudovibrio sp. FO-BEG1]AEV39471.1 hypothetical protein PSE_4969 [Pseudovibrio sp. FO-BEG1]
MKSAIDATLMEPWHQRTKQEGSSTPQNPAYLNSPAHLSRELPLAIQVKRIHAVSLTDPPTSPQSQFAFFCAELR